MPIKMGRKKLYSVKELNELLPITPLTIREYLRKGKIKGHKIGKSWYVTKENLEVFLEGGDQEDKENIEKVEGNHKRA